MMGAVAKLKQSVKSAADIPDKKQQMQRQQQQPKKAPAPSVNCNAWDFHPLVGGLMDLVLMTPAMLFFENL